MARVVHRRTNPPVLVILFVFLFVISAALAAFFYSNLSEQRKLAAEAKRERDALLRPNEQDEQIASIQEAARRDRQSVVGLLAERQRLLATQITGSAVPYEAARDAAAQRLVDQPPTIGLLGLVDELTGKLAAAEARIAQLQLRSESLADALQAKEQGLQEAVSAFAAAEQELETRLQAARRANDELATKFTLELNEARRRWEDDLAIKETSLGQKDDAIAAGQEQVRALRQDADRLAEAIKELRRPIPETVRADGTVIRANLSEGVVYIDLGTQDGVRPGTPFSVFPAGEAINVKTTEPKGTLVVRNADERISECRVTSSGRMPVVEGDAILNIARGLGRKPVFVVAGEFDLDGDGDADPRGMELVAAMIGDYGGQIAESVGYTVDYVVLGSQPALPAAPDPETNPGAAALYAEKQKRVEAYNDAAAAATKHLVPVLNTGRFFNLVGYAASAGK